MEYERSCRSKYPAHIYFIFGALIVFILTSHWLYQSNQIGLANEKKLLEEQNLTIASMCSTRRIWPNHPESNLRCMCKPLYPFFKTCDAKVEILYQDPLVLVVHSYFSAHEVKLIRKTIEQQPLVQPTYTNKFGFSWRSQHFKHKQGLLDGRHPMNMWIFDKYVPIFGNSPCNGYPTMNIAKYSKGAFLKVHHDGFGSHISNVSWTESLAFAVRRVVTVFEDCRQIYTKINFWKCVYLRVTGTLTPSLYWQFKAFGPPIASAMIQLADFVEGGETFFPEIRISVHTHMGDVLYFENTDKQGNNLRKSLHGACPVLNGEKLIIVGRIPGACNNLEDMRAHIFHHD